MNLPLRNAPAFPKPAATYADLVALPENMVGEIINGELYAQARPAGPHGHAEVGMSADLLFSFQRGRGGPGGWWILVEPELHLPPNVLVPDLAGWRRERMPKIPQDHRFIVAPDWVCEILSPSTARKDRVLKMRAYAEQGVAHCWLLDPLARTLEVYSLRDNHWQQDASFGGDETFRAPPFEAVEFALADWWLPDEPDTQEP